MKDIHAQETLKTQKLLNELMSISVQLPQLLFKGFRQSVKFYLLLICRRIIGNYYFKKKINGILPKQWQISSNETCLQRIIVVVFVISDWIFVLMNATTMIPCRKTKPLDYTL